MTQFDLGTSNVLINGAQKGGAVDELPLDSVQEFSTQQNPPAEYGWRDGSSVNLAVKSGTNNISRVGLCLRPRCGGDRREAVLRSSRRLKLSATRRWSSRASRWAVPILKDKLFCFVSGEFIRQSSFDPASYTVPSDAGPAAELALAWWTRVQRDYGRAKSTH